MKNKLEIIVALCVFAALSVSAIAGMGSVNVGNTETNVLTASGGPNPRTWFVLQNNSAVDIYVKIDSSATTLTITNGIKIPANGGTFSTAATPAFNPSRNLIKAISVSGTNPLTYQEGNEK